MGLWVHRYYYIFDWGLGGGRGGVKGFVGDLCVYY